MANRGGGPFRGILFNLSTIAVVAKSKDPTSLGHNIGTTGPYRECVMVRLLLALASLGAICVWNPMNIQDALDREARAIAATVTSTIDVSPYLPGRRRLS